MRLDRRLVAAASPFVHLDPSFVAGPSPIPSRISVWGNLKSTELANLCSESISEVATIADDGLDRDRR